MLPNKEDAKFCFVPVDLSHDEFKERYPDAPVDDFTLTLEGRTTLLDEWFGDDFVRVAEYWERRPEKRMLALLPNGSIEDLTDEPERLAELKKSGAQAVDTLAGVTQALGAVVEQLNAPKRIVRDPSTGRAIGVETVTH
jgi:hypothetical protein